MTPTEDIPPNPAAELKQRLMVMGALSLMGYLAFLFFYGNEALSGPRLNREIFIWPAVIGLSLLYWQGYRVLSLLNKIPIKPVLGFGAAFALTALFIDNFHSTDLLGYINRGWQQAGYGVNPYVMTVDDIPGWTTDPMFADHWVDNPSPYGFLYMQIAWFLTELGGGDHGRTVMVFKLFNLLVFAAVGGITWQAARLLKLPRPGLGLYLFFWNPLLLLHHVANGHNDMVMVLFIMLSALALAANRWLWIGPALSAAVLTKYAAIVIVPFAIGFLIRHQAWKALAGGFALGLAVLGLSALPYLPDLARFKLDAITTNAQVSHASIHHFFFTVYKYIALPFGWEQENLAVRSILKSLLLFIYVICYGWLGVRAIRAKIYQRQDLLRDALLVTLGLVMLASTKFYPWYFGMFFPMALLLPVGHWLRRLVVMVSVFQMLGFTGLGQAHFINVLLMTLLPVGLLFWLERRRKLADNNAPVTAHG